ncbi:MAG: GTP 3',8-cyclase MoaA [Flavobacteriales bacterium]|nr:GTP 3',8-cyclase MoaA [Flavobacteriales bacterium]
MQNKTLIHPLPTEVRPQLIDSFGRVHNYLRISLTERCNLRCFYCMPEEGIPLRDKAHFMNHEEVFGIAKIFNQLGVSKIRLTGGEPLIKKGAKDIIANLAKLDTELAITTNGILVDQFIDVFKDNGIKSVNISLDSLVAQRQEMISRRNYFDRIFKNINLLIDEGFNVKINVVVMNNVNDTELVDFVELTKDKSVQIRFIEFMPFNGNKWSWSKGVGFQKMMNAINYHFGEEKVIPLVGNPNDTAKCFTVENYKGSFGIISSISNPFCGTCNRIRLTADGKMKNCLFSSGETDLLTAYRNGEDLIPLIKHSIGTKKAERAGLDTIEKLNTSSLNTKNRSMISIGG